MSKQRDLFEKHQYRTGLPSVPSDTSEAAAEMVTPSAATMRRRVYEHIDRSGSATCDECEAALQMKHQTCSARIRELVKAGLVEDTGHRRRTRSGATARVYATT